MNNRNVTITSLFLIVFLGIAFGNNMEIQARASNLNKKYKIIRIDSMKSYYIVYGQRDSNVYKIISKKISNKRSDKQIVIGHSYRMDLISQRQKGGKIRPFGSLEVSCKSYDDSTAFCVEKGCVNDLFHSNNLFGLGYSPK